MTPADMEMRARLASLVANRAAPTRTEWRRRTRLILLAGLGWTVGIALFLFRMPSGDGWWWTAGSTAWFGVLGTLSAFTVLSAGGSALGRSRVHMRFVALATIFLALAVAGVAQLFPTAPPMASHANAHIACLKATLMMGLGPMVALFVVKRGSDYVRPRITGMLVGAMSGALGGVGISLHCADQAVLHLTVGHALPVALLGLLGWILGDRIIGGHLES